MEHILNLEQVKKYYRGSTGNITEAVNGISMYIDKGEFAAIMGASGLDKLGISDIPSKFPYEVSVGQKQHCTCARALINEPKLILADELTGALSLIFDNTRNYVLKYENKNYLSKRDSTFSGRVVNRKKHKFWIKRRNKWIT